MIETSSSASNQQDGGRALLTVSILVTVAISACLAILAWFFMSTGKDPYVKASLELQGKSDHGGQLFRMNCAGCHGLTGQGLIGPNLAGISTHCPDRELIHQIISGKTPPMPSFQMNPEAMADLLAYLHTLT